MSEPAWVALGAQAVDYEGAYAAGTQYRPGDVVRYNGVDYICVNPALGQTPAATVIPATPPVIPVVTTLPASPFDGQEVILTDSLTVPTYQWRLRYDAAITDAYKWRFIGGPPTTGYEATDVPTSSTTYVALGPLVVAPRAGIYDCSYSCVVATGSAQDFFWRLANYAATQFGGIEHHQTTQSGNQFWVVYFRDRITLSSVAGNAGLICSQTRNSGASGTHRNRRLEFIPVRLA
jgi:hypothetical protein